MRLAVAWAGGFGRVRRAPAVLVALWLVTVAITIPPVIALEETIRTNLGSSLEANAAADGVNYDWMQEFREGAGPLGRTLRPDVIGFAAVMDNASALADWRVRPMVITVSAVIYVGLLWFLTPGIIHRLAIDRPLHAQRFLSTCGACSARMLRLGVLSTVVYGALFAGLHQWLFQDLFDTVTRETTVERTAFVVRVALYILFFALVAACNVLFDFAKVRMVVEDRHSAVASLAAASRFVAAHARLAFGVYGLNVAAFAAVLALYAAAAPGAGGAGWTMWGGFLVSQAYIAARLFVKLAFWGGEVSAVQGRTAYAGFVRAGR
jgi:hypothetical protein